MAAIKVRNLNFTYPTGDKKALDDVSFDIQPSEFVVVCGKSGCGKSTFLNILSGLLRQDGGSLRIEGKASELFSDWKHIAYMFQEDRLLDFRNEFFSHYDMSRNF